MGNLQTIVYSIVSFSLQEIIKWHNPAEISSADRLYLLPLSLCHLELSIFKYLLFLNLITTVAIATINIAIENVGTYNTNAIIVTVSSDDEYITMIDSSSGIAYAIAGAIVTTETPISFSVSGNVPDGHIAQFESILDDGERAFIAQRDRDRSQGSTWKGVIST